MAFIGMVFASAFLIVAVIYLIITFLFFVLMLILKIVAKVKKNKKINIAGNVFLVLWILSVLPIIAISVYFAHEGAFATVTLPNGEEKEILQQDVSEMKAYLKDPDEDSLRALEALLEKDGNLIYYRDVNRYSLLDHGLKMGNAEIVRIALEHGAIFDDPELYEHRSYVMSSMDDLLDKRFVQSICEGDVEIVKMMFEKNASTEVKKPPPCYSNAFGKAVWVVLYNDETVTDTELELIQTFIDYGLSSDPALTVWEEVPSNYAVHCADVARDENYRRLMKMIGK